MVGLEYEVLYDRSNYQTYKYAIGVLQSKIEEYESAIEGIGEVIEPHEEDEKKKVILEKAHQMLKEMQDYGDELKYRVIKN